MSEQENVGVSSRAATGIMGLDEVLCGGLPRNKLYLIEGEPGVGKTTLGMHFAMTGAANNERVLYVLMSETENETREIAKSHDWKLAGIEMVYQSHSDYLHQEVQQTVLHPAEIELPEATRPIVERIESFKPDRLILDSLSEFRLLAQDERYFRRQILALKEYLANRQCTTLMLDAWRKDFGDVTVHSIASGIIEMEQLAPKFGPTRRRLQVRKVRGMRYVSGYHDYVIRTGGSGEIQHLASVCDRRGRAGERSAIYAFDERIQTIMQRAEGINLDIAKWVEDDTIKLKQVDPAELTPGEFSQMVRQDAREGRKIIVVDSISGYYQSMPEEHFLLLHIHELLSYLNEQGVVTMLIVAQHRVLGANMNPPIDVSYVADTVLLLRYFEHAGEIRQAISVFKKRSGPHERVVRELTLSADGIQIGKALREFRGILTGVPHYFGEQIEDRLE